MMSHRESIGLGYGTVAKSLHWLIVLLLVAQFAIAWAMPEIHRGVQPEGLIGLHLSFGMAILAIALVRVLWRLGNPVPLISDNLPRWQYRIAQATHVLLYLLIFVLPLLGWANASYRGWPIDVFGIVKLPPILPEGSVLGRECGDLHIWTSYVLLGVVGLHLAAALYHRLWLRDRVLSRMLPGGD